jgi:hypothetical protein
VEPRRADPSPPPPCSSEGRKSPEPGVCAVQECNAADVDKALNDTQFRAVLTESAFLWVESQHAVRWLLLLLLFLDAQVVPTRTAELLRRSRCAHTRLCR